MKVTIRKNSKATKPALTQAEGIIVGSVVVGESNSLNNFSGWLTAGTGAASVFLFGSIKSLQSFIGPGSSYVLAACGASVFLGFVQRVIHIRISSSYEGEKLLIERMASYGMLPTLGAERSDEQDLELAERIAAWAPFSERRSIIIAARMSYGERARLQMWRAVFQRCVCLCQAGAVLVAMLTVALFSWLGLGV